MTIKLSANSIEKLFSLLSNKSSEEDINLQIIAIFKMENSNNVYSAILSDSVRKYKNFVLKKNIDEAEFKSSQIINIKTVRSAKLNKEKFPIFAINSYSIIGEEAIFGNPQNFSDEEIDLLMNPGKSNVSMAVKQENELKLKDETNGKPLMTNDKVVEERSSLPSITDTVNVNVKVISYNKPVIPPISKETTLLRHKTMLVDEKSDPVPCTENTYPLSTLTTFTKDVCIYIRVMKKGEVKSFTSNRGQGCLFTFIIMDQDGTEMQASCFNKAAERISEIIENDCVYIIKGGTVKINDRRFNNTKSDFKLVLDDKSIVQKVKDTGEIKAFSIDAVKLSTIVNLSNGSFVDVMGYVIEVNDIIQKTTKMGDSKMRRIFIVDDSLYKLELSLWKANAELPIRVNDVLLCKNLKVGDFNGKNLATFDDSKIILNPKGVEECDKLRKYISAYRGEYTTFTSTGLRTKVVSQNFNVKFMKEILDSLNKYLNSNTVGEEAPTAIKVTIANFHNTEKYVYAGCPDNNCKKKLSESIQSKGYFCNLCNKVYEKPMYYYNIPLIIKDCSCEFWVDVFGSLGDKLIGISANEYKKAFEEADDEKLTKIQERVEFMSFIFQVKPRITNFSNVIKKKLQVTNIDNVDMRIDASRILREMKLIG